MPNWFDTRATKATDVAVESMRVEILRILRAYLAGYPVTVFPDPPEG